MNICSDNRFKIIDKAKQDLINSTNIEDNPDEMKVIDSFLFRCWQMGWLDKYDNQFYIEDVSLDPSIQEVIENNFFEML